MESRGTINQIEGVEIGNRTEYANLIINVDKMIVF
jgi:hypothetical protein